MTTTTDKTALQELASPPTYQSIVVWSRVFIAAVTAVETFLAPMDKREKVTKGETVKRFTEAFKTALHAEGIKWNETAEGMSQVVEDIVKLSVDTFVPDTIVSPNKPLGKEAETALKVLRLLKDTLSVLVKAA
jgi:hypothetical protein